MRLLVVRGDLRSQAGYAAAARDYVSVLGAFFDRIVGVDLHFSPDRPFETFPHPLVTDSEATRLAGLATFALALSCTTPDHYARVTGAANVGLTFWETDLLPPTWCGPANRMDAVWAPTTHTREVWRGHGLTAPVRVVPWPVGVPEPPREGRPDGTVYDLDAMSPLPNWAGRFAPALALASLRRPPASIPSPAILCVAQDVPRKALLLFLSEWAEFKRRPAAEAWSLILKSGPADPKTAEAVFVRRFHEHLRALKRQLGLDRAQVYLWTGGLKEADYTRLIASAAGVVVASLGEGFCGPAAQALALGRPLLAPRHTALCDYLPADYPYTFATRPAVVRFADDPIGCYDPSSSWEVPEPFALADALDRWLGDAPERRADAAKAARERLFQWCGVAREVLANEVRRLETARRAA